MNILKARYGTRDRLRTPDFKFISDSPDTDDGALGKYGFMGFRDGKPVREYIRYRRLKDHLKLCNRPQTLEAQRTDSSFDPLFASSERIVTKKKNIWLLVNILLNSNSSMQHDENSWEELPKDMKFFTLYEASLSLLSTVYAVHEKLNDINIVKMKRGSQVADRKKYVILWRSMASHLRYHFRKHRLAIDWTAFKFIADHHPRAELRTYFSGYELSRYFPEIKAEECTVIETSINRKKVGLRNMRSFKSFPDFQDYVKWLERRIPHVRPILTQEETSIGLTMNDIRGTERRQYRARKDICKELRLRFEGEQDPDKKAKLLHEVDVLEDLSTPIEDVREFAIFHGINTIEKIEHISHLEGHRPKRKRKKSSEMPQQVQQAQPENRKNLTFEEQDYLNRYKTLEEAAEFSSLLTADLLKQEMCPDELSTLEFFESSRTYQETLLEELCGEILEQREANNTAH